MITITYSPTDDCTITAEYLDAAECLRQIEVVERWLRLDVESDNNVKEP